jgi:hypothetical protein
MQISKAQVDLAYRKLKSLVYYDKTDLRLRARLAEFECNDAFDNKLAKVRHVVNSDAPAKQRAFRGWLTEIGYRLVPKRLKPRDDVHSDEDKGRYITNVTTSPTIEVDQVNYFFDGPIELHLIAVLWIMIDGVKLDTELGAECCGSRLSGNLLDSDDDSIALFAKYHEQYARWRDSGISKAKQLLVDDGVNVAILGLDIQEYFYRVSINFEEVRSALHKSNDGFDDDDSPLLDCIQEIGITYQQRIAPLLQLTHPDLETGAPALPIGLCSSLILANWYLMDFDSQVLKEVRPAYYGRYVDDLLLVVPLPIDPAVTGTNPVQEVIHLLLVKTRVLNDIQGGNFSIRCRAGLRLQQSKCILQYFDARHSIAGLEKFRKKLEQNGSDFLLLPVEEADNSLEDVAYELLYEGSANKFRSVKGVAENRYELAKHLARQTILQLLTDDPPNRKVTRGMQKFFKGRSAIEFYDLWERVFTLLEITKDRTTFKSFSKQLKVEISRIDTKVAPVKTQIKSDLSKHLELSMAMADAVCSDDVVLSELIDNVHSETLRRANLMRHHYIRRPLLNYTTYSGPLSARAPTNQVKQDLRKMQYSPRFVNFDECMLLAYSGDIPIGQDTVFTFAKNIFNRINRRNVAGVEWAPSEATEE